MTKNVLANSEANLSLDCWLQGLPKGSIYARCRTWRLQRNHKVYYKFGVENQMSANNTVIAHFALVI